MSKKIVEPITEYWQWECLESLFGSEALFNVKNKAIKWDENGEESDWERVDCEVVVRREKK